MLKMLMSKQPLNPDVLFVGKDSVSSFDLKSSHHSDVHVPSNLCTFFPSFGTKKTGEVVPNPPSESSK